ncbi:MAG: 16S rRNA (uracil(1498)-N(3))-methyltransferase [Lachnospiraceae bacterium]|nr:16S rRNA (uracil(1498)-N(3))-methyltransferase [Lachnospiraceae bacterium]
MYQFFIDGSQIADGHAIITGSDYNHMKNVLRIRPGERFYIAVQAEPPRKYICTVDAYTEQSADCRVLSEAMETHELPCSITLYQGLPKADKLEWIIEKSVELGVDRIVPVAMERSVMKIDPKKADTKLNRWQNIAQAAAKQSKRDVIPNVCPVCSFPEALKQTDEAQVKLLPYENARGMEATRDILRTVQQGEHIAVFIGPEGGFSEKEVKQALAAGFQPLTLGKRILRTETAVVAVLSMLAYELEE